uniref:VPS9 domain-containing protein n=1 Tax=Syphacia muris TaxID=451379 RepID=A0A0N5ADU5_9BILA
LDDYTNQNVITGSRSSDYAQLSECVNSSSVFNGKNSQSKDDDNLSVAGTVFNEPWDSNVWENLLNLAQYGDEKPGGIKHGDSSMNACIGILLPRVLPHYAMIDDPILGSMDDISSSIRALSPIISPPRLRDSLNSDPSTKIQEYVERISCDENTVFGATLKRFTECTIEGEENDPQVVIRNVRQFLNGMKNYLVKHGEGELHEIIEKERARLNANEFLNIDAILEAILHKIVLSPVKPHLYHLMVREHSKNGWLQSLSENLTYFAPPSPQKMEAIKICLRKMQHHYSPLKKLENLMRVIFMVIGQHPTGDSENFDPITGDTKARSLPPADELVRWLVYLLARTSTVGCEVEAWYMWELLPKQLLTTGDTSYYLTALFSAVDVLKSAESVRKLGYVDDPYSMDGSCSSTGSTSPVAATSDAFVRVAIPDEIDGSIRYHTFPGVPQMTAGKLCRVIAHQFGITNPEDHGLYLLVDGFETCLLSNECPDLIRHQLRQARKAHLFAYKRHEAKIAWPKVAMNTNVH